MKRKKWYKLDNIGTFYSFTNKSKIPAVFRYSVTLTSEIDKDILQTALDKTIEEFPNFYVHLKKGLFWYYLESASNKVLVLEENTNICKKIYKDSDDVLFRVNFYNKRINLEISHILSDGRGTLKFFKTLVTNYIVLKYDIKDNINIDKTSNDDSEEDSYDKHYTKDKIRINRNKNIYQYKGRKKKNTTFIEYHISSSKALKLAHSYNTSLTVLLLSVLINSYKYEMKDIEFNKTIKIDVPVDFRKYFDSNTTKNFFGLTSVSYKFKNRDEPFENIIKSVHKELKNSTDLNALKVRMNGMIFFEKNIFSRITPIFIKDFVLKIADYISSSMSTSSLSNMGKIEVDQKVEKYIENFNVLNTTNSLKLTICSFKDDLSIGISSMYENTNIIKHFCDFFTNHEIYGTLNINRSSDNEEM